MSLPEGVFKVDHETLGVVLFSLFRWVGIWTPGFSGCVGSLQHAASGALATEKVPKKTMEMWCDMRPILAGGLEHVLFFQNCE